jgi:hypothetical protein
MALGRLLEQRTLRNEKNIWRSNDVNFAKNRFGNHLGRDSSRVARAASNPNEQPGQLHRNLDAENVFRGLDAMMIVESQHEWQEEYVRASPQPETN